MQATLSEPDTKSAGSSLPRRDWILLPLISLLTIFVLVGVAESVTRVIWPQQEDDACAYYDPAGFRHRAGCVSQMKNVEGPWVRYQYNSCGYRGTESCGPKPASVSRFAVIGTSIAFGLYVPNNQIFATLAVRPLSRILGRPVQFENLGMIGPDFPLQYKLTPELERLQSDAVFFVVVPYDLKRLDDAPKPAVPHAAPVHHRLFGISDFAYLGRSSRAFFIAQHFLLRDREFAVRAFMMKSDPDDVAHVPITPLAEQRYDRLAILIDRMSADLRAHGIPLYVIPLPSRLQAALVGEHKSIPNVDPLAFIERVSEISQNAGAKFIDISPELRKMHDPERLYYAVDGHLTGTGNQVIADAVVQYFKQNDVGR